MSKRRKYKGRKKMTKAQIAEAVERRKNGDMIDEIAADYGVSHTQVAVYCYGMDPDRPLTEEERERCIGIYNMSQGGASREEIGHEYGISTASVDKYCLAGDRLFNNPEIFEKQKNKQITIEEITEPPRDEDNHVEEYIACKENKTLRVQLIMQPSILGRAKAEADKQQLSFNEYVHRALSEKLNAKSVSVNPNSADIKFREKISNLIFEAACNNDFELCGLLAPVGEFLVKREGENNEH